MILTGIFGSFMIVPWVVLGLGRRMHAAPRVSELYVICAECVGAESDSLAASGAQETISGVERGHGGSFDPRNAQCSAGPGPPKQPPALR